MEPEQSQVPATCPYPEPFSLLWLHQSISPVPRHTYSSTVSQHDTCLRWGVVSTSPNPQSGVLPLVGYTRLLIQYIRCYHPYSRPFLHTQPEDAPCRGDRDPLITEFAVITVLISAIEIRVVAINRYSSLHVVKFDRTMFRPMYKEPPVRLQGTRRKVPYNALIILRCPCRDMHRLSTGIRSEKFVVRRFRRRAKVI